MKFLAKALGILFVTCSLVMTGCGGGSSSTPLSSTKAITAFSLSGLTPVVTGVIGETGHTITLNVPFGTDVTALVPTITHSGASISPASGTAKNFTSPVSYVVTAADATTQTYVVTVVVAPSPAKTMTAFSFAGLNPPVVGTVTEANHTVALTVPNGTNVTALVPTISHTGASISPASGAAHDFTNPVNYVVTAADATTQTYVVTVTIANPPTQYATPGTYSYVVPAGVTSISLKMWGAGGMASGAGNGGAGGYVAGTIATTPGETLTLKVAGAPLQNTYDQGGFNGGGNGGSYTGANIAGGGGGASQVLRGSTVLLVAGGGGGGGNGAGGTATGGAGGGTSGQAGGDGPQGLTFGGGGGTQVAGGAGGDGPVPGLAGSSGQGGNGGVVAGASPQGGGGGGGGYYGGGAGGGDTSWVHSGAGGGGGSSYTNPTVTNATNTAGSGTTPGNSADADRGTAGDGGILSGALPGDGKIVLQ